MRLPKDKKSKNFVDKTGYDQVQLLLDSLFSALNPVSGYRNIRSSMIKNGIIDPPKRTFDWK